MFTDCFVSNILKIQIFCFKKIKLLSYFEFLTILLCEVCSWQAMIYSHSLRCSGRGWWGHQNFGYSFDLQQVHLDPNILQPLRSSSEKDTTTNILFLFSQPTYILCFITLLYCIYSAICRPSDCTLGRPQAKKWTPDGQSRGRGHWPLDTTPPNSSFCTSYRQ